MYLLLITIIGTINGLVNSSLHPGEFFRDELSISNCMSMLGHKTCTHTVSPGRGHRADEYAKYTPFENFSRIFYIDVVFLPCAPSYASSGHA